MLMMAMSLCIMSNVSVKPVDNVRSDNGIQSADSVESGADRKLVMWKIFSMC